MCDCCELVGELPRDCLSAICQEGDNDYAVRQYADLLAIDIPRKVCIAALEYYGAWSKRELDKSLKRDLIDRVLWLAAWCQFENGYHN